MFLQVFFSLFRGLFVLVSFFPGVICRDDVGETRTFTKGFQQYDPVSRKTRVVWIIDKWVWFPHDFQIRRLWWCTCWASSSSEGWMAMGSIKTQQWRLSSVLWPWSSGSVLGQERIRISSRWSTTCLAEIALRIRPPVEDGQGSWRWRYEIFGGNGPSLPRFSNWKKQISFRAFQRYPIPSRRWRPFTERGEDPASIIFVGRKPWRSTDISSGSGGIFLLQKKLRHGLLLLRRWGCKMRPATAALWNQAFI